MAKNDPAQELRLAPLTREEAELTSRWRYTPELATYDGTTAAISEMLDPANRYHSIHLVGDYIGYVIPLRYYHLDGYEPRTMSFFGPNVPSLLDNLIRAMAVDLYRN